MRSVLARHVLRSRALTNVSNRSIHSGLLLSFFDTRSSNNNNSNDSHRGLRSNLRYYSSHTVTNENEKDSQYKVGSNHNDKDFSANDENEENEENITEADICEPDDGLVYRRKSYYRAKELGIILKKKMDVIIRDFTMKHRKRYYTFQNGKFYEFQSTKEIIIDEDAILKTKNVRNKTLLLNSKYTVKRENFQPDNLEKTPVIVILGHFNHGKTTLLDALGDFTIAEKEAHGITQEIRTCHVPIVTNTKSSIVTIIDTPGQDIFYRMRNYGVSVADMVILMVSLEDGVCNQTEESIGAVETILNRYKGEDNHKNIPIIVCMNKMDSEKIQEGLQQRITDLQNDLMDYNILDNAIFIPISAKIGTNLDLLKNSIIDAVQIYREAEKRLSEETEKKKIEQEAETKRKIENMAVENRGVTKGEGEGDAGEKEAEDFGSIDGIEYTGSSSKGVLLDIIKSRKLGTTLHVVIKEGQVKEGDYFAAGGWSGKIKRISHENGDSAITNRTFENGRIAVGECGWGVKMNVTMNRLCEEPNPLGDEILFFSSDGSLSYTKLVEKSRNTQPHMKALQNEKMKNESSPENSVGDSSELTIKQHQKYLIAYEQEADKLASDYADRTRMSHMIESYALTDETADRIRLPQLWQIIKKRGNKKKASWDKSKKPVKEPTIYDENGMRIIFHDFEEADADNESEENDEDDDEDDEESDNEGEEDEEMEGGEMEEIDEEEDEKERSKAELLNEQNLRIKENNKREEEISRQKDLDRKKGRSIIVRTLSDVYLSTITDCLIEEDYENEEDENEYNNKKEMEKKSKTDGQHDTASDNFKKSLSLPIISASIGEITARDILIAGSANATIIAYCLPLNADTQKLAQERGVRIVAFDKFADIIRIIKNGLYVELLEMAKKNQKAPSKKNGKKKKKKTK